MRDRDLTYHALRCAFAWLLPLLTLLPAAWVSAAEKKPPELPVKAVFADRTADLEKQIAALALQRPGTPPARIAELELRIDLRILDRWFLNQCLAAPGGSDLQIAAYLRYRHLADAIAALEPSADAATDPSQPVIHLPNPPTPAQGQALLKIHQLTFSLADAKDVAQLDTMARSIGQSLAAIVDQPLNPPSMRPAPLPASEPANSSTQPSLAQLRQIVRANAVAVEVRQQLLALADQAAALAADPHQRQAYHALYQVLAGAVDLAQGLATNTAVTPETRRDIETQLAEGLALYGDPRTRAAGQTRLDALRQYRTLVSRYGKLDLPPEVKARLAPAFTYAGDNPRPGAKVLAAIDHYATLIAAYDALKPPAGADPARRFLDELRKQFDGHRAQFLDDAAQLSGGSALTAGPDALVRTVDEMQHELETLQVLSAMPASLDTLSAYKPRPHGALARQINLASVAATSTTQSPARAEAANLLKQIGALADAAQALSRRPVANVPADIAQRYAANTLDAFDAKWKAMVSDVASQLAAGTVDRAKIERLELARQMLDALNRAVTLEMQLHDAPVLTRWADWTLSPQSLAQVFIPWRDALSNAFDGFMRDRSEPIEQWMARDRRDRPLFDLLTQASQYSDACRRLPPGLAGALATLTTPLDNQPFVAERFASFGLPLLIAAPVADADATARLVLKRLAADLGLHDSPPPKGK